MKTYTVYFDRARKNGKWCTIVKDGSGVMMGEHPTERAARRFIGLDGGSEDPDYRPPADQTGGESRVIHDPDVDIA
jgi:hypothetical protein